MARGNNEARFTANITDFETKINQMTKTIDNFSKKGLGSVNGLVGAFARLAPAVTAAVGAYAVFDRAMQSSQSLGDSYARMQAGLTTSIDNFFVSLTSGDWSAFEGGLMNMIRKAGEAQDAIDQLGNSVMSLSVVNAKENDNFQKQLTILKSAKKGSEEYNNALESARKSVDNMSTATAIVQTDQWNSIAKTLASWTNLSSGDVQFDWVLNAQTLDASEDRDALKEKARADVKIYNQELKKLDKEFYTLGGSMNAVQKEMRDGKSYSDYQNRLSELNSKYGESIVTVTLLDRKNDEQLKGINDLTIAYYNGEAAIESYRQRLARLAKDTGTSGGKPTPFKMTAQDEINNNYLTNASFFDDIFNSSKRIDLNELLQNAPWEVEEGENDSFTYVTKKMKEAQATWDKFQDSMRNEAVTSLASAFQTLGNAIGGAEGAMISLVGTMAQQVTQGITTIASLKAQEEEHRANMTAALGDAAAQTMNAHSWIPFVGVAMGVGMVASIVATLMSLPKFATGGIVGGNNHNDGILARVSSGEMILNQTQQANLMNMLNGQGAASNERNIVEFKIRDTELIGVLNGYNAKLSRRI